MDVSSSDCTSCIKCESVKNIVRSSIAQTSYLTRLNLAAKDAHKLGQVLKVTRHFRGQYHIDNCAARRFVRLLVQVLENVDLIVACRQSICQRKGFNLS